MGIAGEKLYYDFYFTQNLLLIIVHEKSSKYNISLTKKNFNCKPCKWYSITFYNIYLYELRKKGCTRQPNYYLWNFISFFVVFIEAFSGQDSNFSFIYFLSKYFFLFFVIVRCFVAKLCVKCFNYFVGSF